MGRKASANTLCPEFRILVGPRAGGLRPIEEGLFGEAHPLREEHAFVRMTLLESPMRLVMSLKAQAAFTSPR